MLGGAAQADAPPLGTPATISVRSDGFLWHDPAGLRLPREIIGPSHTHIATLTAISPQKVELIYGPIVVTISAPTAAADPIVVPAGWAADPAPPTLPSLLFWGEAAAPVTTSFIQDGSAPAERWLSFVIIADGWQIELSSLHSAESRDTVVRTAEAVWAILASANAELPRRPPAP